MPDDRSTRPVGLSMFFPAYNDGGTIASLVILAVQVAGRLTPDFEVIVVNTAARSHHGICELARTSRACASFTTRAIGIVLPRCDRLRGGDQLLVASPRRRAIHPAELGCVELRTPSLHGDRLQDPSRILASHRDRRLYHHTGSSCFSLPCATSTAFPSDAGGYSILAVGKTPAVICLEIMRKIHDAFSRR